MRACAFFPYLQDLRRLKNDCSICSDPNFAKDVRPIWGCDGDSIPSGYQYDLGSYKTRRCPLALMRQVGVQDALRLYKAWKRGITPKGRGTLAETAFYVRLMCICENLEAEAKNWYETEIDKKHRKKKK